MRCRATCAAAAPTTIICAAPLEPGLASPIGVESKDLVFVAEFCGGGFGGKAGGYPLMALPALMSKKLGGRPCLLRVSREEE